VRDPLCFHPGGAAEGVDKYLLIVHGGSEEVEQARQIIERTEAVEKAICKA